MIVDTSGKPQKTTVKRLPSSHDSPQEVPAWAFIPLMNEALGVTESPAPFAHCFRVSGLQHLMCTNGLAAGQSGATRRMSPVQLHVQSELLSCMIVML